MKIPLDKIHPPKLELIASAEDAWVQSAVDIFMAIPSGSAAAEGSRSAAIAFKIRREGDRVYVGGRIEVDLVCTCDRCGEAIRLHLDGPVDQLYLAPQTEADPADYDLVESELEVGWHDGQALDLEMVLTEALALTGPDRVRCEDVGVFRISGEGPCELPENSNGVGPERINPFAALKLS